MVTQTVVWVAAYTCGWSDGVACEGMNMQFAVSLIQSWRFGASVQVMVALPDPSYNPMMAIRASNAECSLC